MNLDFSKRRILVTGATSGIGKEIAIEFFKLNAAKIFVTGRRIELLKSLQSDMNDYNNIVPFQADLSRDEDVLRLGKYIVDNGGVDIIVHSAGSNSKHSFFDVTEDEWDNIMNTNVKSSFILIKELMPAMIKNQYGRIIILSSVVARTGGLGNANCAYVSSKGAINGLVKNIAVFAGKYGITVNSVSPSFVETEILEKSGINQIKDRLIKLHPVGRLGTVKDIANAVMFLASEESGFVTGQDVAVNGGYVMN
jgi:3-oxoacyl-[acyl-carrier protein] reductase